MKVGVVGASGYAGVELLRLCAQHPEFEVVVASAGSHAGDSVAGHTTSLAAAYPRLTYSTTDPAAFDGLDLVFLALPHGESQHLVPALAGSTGPVIDLAADFRLRDAALYPRWYGADHVEPGLLDRFVYGLPELHRGELVGADRIAAPGCYPTAAILALTPFVESGSVQIPPIAPSPSSGPGPVTPAIIVDAASGVSGAGRAPKGHLQFGAVDGDFTAYGLLDHRHTAEMEQALGASVLFTPHLAPMVRGILATCYALPAAGGMTTGDALDILHHRYDDERFLVVTDGSPSTKATAGSNCVQVTARVDPRTGWLVVIAALDNLIKGASGQAIQCANLSVGLPEHIGLPLAGAYP